MKKILQATGQKDHAGLIASESPEANSTRIPTAEARSLDLGALDQETHRAIHSITESLPDSVG